MSNISATEYKDLICNYAGELVEEMTKTASAEDDGFDAETVELLERTDALYKDAGARMDAAIEVLAECAEILEAADGIDLDKVAAEEDDDTLEIIASAYQRYNVAMEVLAEAEEDADACETVMTAAGLLDDEYDEDEDEAEDEE